MADNPDDLHSDMNRRCLLLITLLLLFASLPGPVLSQDDAFPLPDLEPITQENIDRLELLETFGYGIVQDMAWSPDGETIAAAGTLGVQFYDAEAFDAAPHSRLNIPENVTRFVAFSPDGTLLATLSDNGFPDSSTRGASVARLWQFVPGTAGGMAAATLVTEWEIELYHGGGVTFSPGGDTLVILDRLPDLPFWDDTRRALLWDISDLPDLHVLPKTTWSALQHEWRPPELDVFVPGDAEVVAYSADGDLVAYVASPDRLIHVWNLANHEELVIDQYQTVVYVCGVTEMLFSTDGSMLVVPCLIDPGTLYVVWDSRTGELLSSQEGLPGQGAIFHPTEPVMVYEETALSTTVVRWEAESRTEQIVLGYGRRLRSLVYDAVFSPNGSTLAVMHDDFVVIWDLTGVKLGMIHIPWDDEQPAWWGTINSVTYNPDGTLLAIADYTNVVHLYDAETLSELASIQLDAEVVDVAFSPDGRLLATYRNELSPVPASLLLWDLETVLEQGEMEIGMELAEFPVGRLGAVLTFREGSMTVWDVASVAEQTPPLEWDALEYTIPGYTAGDETRAIVLKLPFNNLLMELIPVLLGPGGGDQLVTRHHHDTDCYIAMWNAGATAPDTYWQCGTDLLPINFAVNVDGTIVAASHSVDFQVGPHNPDTTIRFWDTQTGEVSRTLDTRFELVGPLAFNAQGTLFASVCGIFKCSQCLDHGVVRLWGVLAGD